jgi:3-hydroxyisobutyrate dehydrogenase
MEQIGVIGLGRMGSAIAQRLNSEGLIVHGWTRSGRLVDGVESAADLETLVRDSETLILSLLDDAAVAGVLDALLTYDLKGKQIIETSTVKPSNLIDRNKRSPAKGQSLLMPPFPAVRN